MMKVLSRIEKRNGRKVLVVDEKPFIMLAGEVHNSNSSSVAYMEGVYDQADALGMNCLLIPVTWELVEPEEGVFDFSLMDALIMQARERGKKLGFLWFGAWKNAQCYYAPEWVKTDLNRFKRAQMEKGKTSSGWRTSMECHILLCLTCVKKQEKLMRGHSAGS